MSGLIKDDINEITDPSDWGNSQYPQLSQLDSMMRCQICKEFLKSPVLTTCGHLFCSMCVRHAIGTTNKCPICLEETYESGLRKVLLLDGIVNWFDTNRKDLLKQLSAKDIKDVQEVEDSQGEEGVSQTQNDHGQANDSNSSREDMAECPICGVFMDMQELQGKHIDNCLVKPATNKNSHGLVNSPRKRKGLSDLMKPTHTKKQKQMANVQLQPENIKRKQRLPNLDTSLTTAKLKEKLNTYKLPNNGTRDQLLNRLKEYITIYNANLDSLNPVQDRILVSRLSKWESLVNKKNKHIGNQDPDTTIDSTKKERREWAKLNADNYKSLIAAAKMNKQKQRSLSGKKDDVFSDDDLPLQNL
ncbi:E3 ubiquitin-protein ligase [Martiniozyma asiatica (nom. inval.)]|nr:E3 ubiquitin-protein ligase [Martiniozyma asiatica]